jgi:hypothetical protein
MNKNPFFFRNHKLDLNPISKLIIIGWSLTKLVFFHVDQKSMMAARTGQYRPLWEYYFQICFFVTTEPFKWKLY